MDPKSNNPEIKPDNIVEDDSDSTTSIASSADPIVGSILNGHIKILSCLGAGGMSLVYKAEDLLLKRIVAVKILHPHSSLNPQNVLRFRQEAMAASKIDHPNVIRVYEFNVPDQGQPYLVMDFVEGLSLADFIKQNGPIEMRRAISLMGIICDGLQCAHDAGVVHRDLKPGNIMLLKNASGQQTLKIVDFGIAKLLTENPDSHALTQTGEVFGSPLYMSPEQCYGKTLDARSDIYSLGCVMYEMCTGQPPIKGSSLLETIQLQTTSMPTPSRSIYSGIKYGAQFDHVINRAMAKDPNERFQTASEFKTALLEIPKAPGANGESVDQTRTRTVALSAIAATVIIVSIFAIFPNMQKIPTNPLQSQTSPVGVAQQSPTQRAEITERRTSDEGIRLLYEKPPEEQPDSLYVEDSNVSDKGLKAIAHNQRLRILNCSGSSITDLSGPTIGSLPNLEKLEVEHTNIGDAFIRGIADSKKIWHLWIQQTHVTSAGTKYLAKLPLKELSLSENDIGDSGLSQISGLQDLTELMLTRCKLTGAGLKHLENMHAMKRLLLAGNHIGDEGVQHLLGLKNLTVLGAEDIGLTDSGVRQLTALTKLERLSLSKNNITPLSLQYLSTMPNLKVLRVSSRGITKAQLAQFKSMYPRLRVN